MLVSVVFVVVLLWLVFVILRRVFQIVELGVLKEDKKH